MAARAWVNAGVAVHKQGRSLNVSETNALLEHFPAELLASVVLHENRVPWWLLWRYAAVTLRHHIYMRVGAYQAGTLEGIELLAHEMTHVAQFADGMTYFKYLWSCLRGYINSPYEREAYTKAASIREAHSRLVG